MYYIANRMHYDEEKKSLKRYDRFSDLLLNPCVLWNSTGLTVYREMISGDHRVMPVSELLDEMTYFLDAIGVDFHCNE